MPNRWKDRIVAEVKRLSAGNPLLVQFGVANAQACIDVVRGIGEHEGHGARAVVNIASEHVPKFCQRSKSGVSPAYQNCYNLGTKTIRFGGAVPDDTWSKRERVDHALIGIHGQPMDQVYFAALELNGAGIRFYGDVCLVLKLDAIDPDTFMLDRNSFDILRSPLSAIIASAASSLGELISCRIILLALSGKWAVDRAYIAATKIIGSVLPRARRLTAGQISAALLDDEDYIEVLKVGSFTTDDLERARVNASELAIEQDIASRAHRGNPSPSLTEIMWLRHRRAAAKALRNSGVLVSPVAFVGRSRG